RLGGVGGVLAVAEGARRLGAERLLCPADSAREAALAGVAAIPIRHLAEAVAYLRGERELEPEPPLAPNGFGAKSGPDLADVRGQERARRALELAAAGGHNVLLGGPPGTGKTMLALRQPLEDGFVSVSRAASRVVFPARFQLIATMNLCPCGGRGDPAAQCSCSAQRLARYRDKLSRALLDRFDLVLAMPRVRGEELAAAPAESSTAVAARVAMARDRLVTSPPSRDQEADALLRRAADR